MKKILVAEDEPVTRALVTRSLEQLGYSVRTAEDGPRACELAEAEQPDLILLDIMLPRRDGYAVLLHLRSKPSTGRVPVVLLSAEPMGKHAAIARTLGAQGYLEKPFTVQALKGIVDAALQDSRGGSSDR